MSKACLAAILMLPAFGTSQSLAEERPLRSLDSYHPFRQVSSKDAWNQRARSLRQQILVALGLSPMPSKHPLNAVIHGKVERDDYTIEKVYFESWPGHYVSGSLYRPKGIQRGAKVPGILSPHGHWKEGRFHDHGTQEFGKQLLQKAEAFPSGRHPLQARCVHLARMGCVVFHYDMVGYADSQQLDHRSSLRKDGKGLFSPAAEARLQNMMGIQTYNSIRALDFLSSLAEIDTDRIGVTGASGGGTQTFMLGAVDDRPDLLFPAVMVSTGMQGGCVCENASHLRVGAGNVDLAALAVPRPLGLTGADDWTIEIETKGAPDLRNLYRLHHADEHFEVFPYLQFGHNFNAVSRKAMYGFVKKHFHLEDHISTEERAFEPLSKAEMSVWNDAHPAPRQRGDAHETALMNWWAADSDAQLATLEARRQDNADADARYTEIIGGGWSTIIGRNWDEVGPVNMTMLEKTIDSNAVHMSGEALAKDHQERVALEFLHPKEGWNGQVLLRWEQQAAEHLGDGRDWLAKGFSLVVVSDDLKEAPLVNPKFAGYTYGYNPTLFARRVHDLLTVMKGIQDHPDWDVKRVHLYGERGGGLLALAAAHVARDMKALGKVMVLSDDAPFHEATQQSDPWFVPGWQKYRGAEGLARLVHAWEIPLSQSSKVSAIEWFGSD